ncbi:MAG: RHS repeat-associated core domain-containing protein, partial [Polyangiaceae bacterium]|nr:RHS repeat-associated core domain-containing protein [Polyangiaceae bacterium]
YTWDTVDQLVKVHAANGASVENVFDGDGVRRVRVEHGVSGDVHTTHFLDDATEVRDGKLTRFVVHGGRRIAKLTDGDGAPSEAKDSKGGCSTSGHSRTGVLAALATLAVVAAFGCKRRLRFIAPLLCITLTVLGCGGGNDGPPPLLEGTIQVLTDADELYFTDAIGSLAEQTSGTGTLKGSFAAYPYGVKRYDTSNETRKYAGTPRDEGVGLDLMGARSYAPDLGVWTSPDPVALMNPERGIGHSFSANHPYAYAANSPINYVDRSGQWPTEWDWKDFKDFAQGVGDQIADTAKEIATTTLQGLASGDSATIVKFTPIGAAASAAVGTVQLAHDVANFGDDFAKAVFAPSYYETGRGTVKVAATAVGAVTTALGVKASIEGVAAGAAPKGTPVPAAAKAGGRVEELGARAAQVHGVLDPIAAARRTTAALDTTAGRIIAGGARDLTPAQRAALLPGEIAARLPGAHAEVTAIETARGLGATPQAISVTRPICPECAAAIEASGGTLTSPTTAAW